MTVRTKGEGLDIRNTLRYIENALGNGAVVVAIEFTHGGRKWRVDTAREAIELREQLEVKDRAASEAGEEPDWIHEQVWTDDVVMDLLKSIGPQQKSFIKSMFDVPEVTSVTVKKDLSLASDLVLAGVLSGLSKQLKKIGLKPWNLYTTQVTWAGRDKSRSFSLSNDFRFAAKKLGWPEEWF